MAINTFGDLSRCIERFRDEDRYIEMGIYMRLFLNELMDYYLDKYYKSQHRPKQKDGKLLKPINSRSKLHEKLNYFYEVEPKSRRYMRFLYSICNSENEVAHISLKMLNDANYEKALKKKLSLNFDFLIALTRDILDSFENIQIYCDDADETIFFAGHRICIMSYKNNMFVTSGTDRFNDNDVTASATAQNMAAWEIFTVEKNLMDKKAVSLKTVSGCYLSACLSRNNSPLTNSPNNDQWEAFRIYKRNGKYYLFSVAANRYITVENDNCLYARSDRCEAWEEFKIEIL